MRFLGAERRPADQALEHDGTDTPPITSKVVTLTGEDLRSNIIRSTNGGVSELTARFAPGVDLVAVTDGELDLIDAYRLAVCSAWACAGVGHELLVVRSVVFLVEAGGETEISQLDVSTTVEKDVVGFDVTGQMSEVGSEEHVHGTHR